MFDDLLGNDNVKKELTDSIIKHNILHSYMFVGQEGIGKRQFAIEFAKAILCINDKQTSCSSCDSCIKFASNNHPDFIYVEPDGNSIKITQMREVQQYIFQKPVLSPNKVIVINDAEKMTEEAQNSLLKTLEEPPSYVIIILIVANENRMLNTIKSRCIKISFSNLTDNELLKYIKDNDLLGSSSSNLLKMCNGSIGKAKKIQANMEKYTAVENMLNKILENGKHSIIDIMKDADVLYKSKENISELFEYMIVIVYNHLKRDIKDVKANNYYNIINVIENTKVKLIGNSNFDMSIDELIFKISDIVENI